MSSRTVVQNLFPVALAILGLLLIWALLGNLLTPVLVFVLGVLLAIVLYPVKQFMVSRWNWPNVVAVAFTVTVALTALLGLIAVVVPTLIEQVRNVAQLTEGLTTNAGESELADRLPNQAAGVLANDDVQSVLNGLRTAPSSVAQTLLDVATQVVSVLGYAFFVVLVMVFTLAGTESLVRSLLQAVPERSRERTERALERIRHGIATWGLANIVLSLLTGGATAIGYGLVGVENALLYGVIQGLGELVPNVGPIVAGGVAVLGVLLSNPALVLPVLGVTVAVQVLEGFIAPLFYGKTVRLHPVSIVLTVLLLGSRFGLLGALLAVPVLVIIKVLYEEFYLSHRSEVNEQEVTDVLQAPAPSND